MTTASTSAISRRLPHIVTRADLAALLAPSYAAAMRIDEDEALDRLARAVDNEALRERLYSAVEEALRAARGARTTEDALMDKLAQGLHARRGRAKATPATPEVSTALVSMSLAAGEGSEAMRGPIESDRGRALAEAGYLALGAHLVRELLK